MWRPGSIATQLVFAAALVATAAAAQDAGPDATVGEGGADASPELDATVAEGGADASPGLDATPRADGDDAHAGREVSADDGADAGAGASGHEPEGGALSLAVDPALGLVDDEAWIFVDKSERRMVVNDGRGWREAFRVALGPHPVGDKEMEGDGRTPEGEFYVCRRVKHDRFHRFLGLSYPAPEDAVRGAAAGLLMPVERRAIHRAARLRIAPPWRTKLGGNVGIHGYGRRRDRAARHARGEDWTDGCIAVTNEEIERIYDHIRLKTKVVIVP